MAIYSGLVFWKGDSGGGRAHVGVSRLPLIGTWSDLVNFVTAMSAHTLCNAGKRVRINTGGPSGEAPEAGADLGRIAILYYRDPTDLTVFHFSYPAPIAADIETTAAGKRIKQSSVATMVSLISTVSGVSYIPLYGVYMERP